MEIAILGFGTVGSGVYEILQEPASPCTSHIKTRAILIKKGKPKTLSIMVDDIQEIAENPNIETVVEAMGGIEPAHTYIKTCLEHKKHVVTANKAVVAKYLEEFQALAKKHQVHFLFEASTGGGIPWIHAIENVKRIDTVSELHGIFNGTSNYILDHMYKDNASFSEILKTAQQLGFAEADPSADIDGYDIQNKLQISASIAFNCYVDRQFPVFGIRTIQKTDIEFFKERNRVLKFIAAAQAIKNGYHCVIEPRLYPISSLEANVPENYNLACIYGTTIGDLKFYGQGAGKLPTANAVVQDIIDILEHKTTPVPQMNKTSYYAGECEKSYWIRTAAIRKLKELCNDKIKEEQLFQTASYFLIHPITEDHMHAVMKEILKEDDAAMMAAWEEEYA